MIQDELKKLIPQKVYKATDYLKMLWHLLPDGSIWKFYINKITAMVFQDSTDPSAPEYSDTVETGSSPVVWQDVSFAESQMASDGLFGNVLATFAEELNRVDDQIITLQRESIPGLSVQLLPDWEKALGLPDDVNLAPTTLVDRQSVAHAKFTQKDQKALTKNYFITYASKLGFTVVIEEFGEFAKPFICAPDGVDLYDIGSRCGDRINSKEQLSVILIRVLAGDPGLDVLIASFDAINPAHTIFTYQDERI